MPHGVITAQAWGTTDKFFVNSNISFRNITDGLSHTFLTGEKHVQEGFTAQTTMMAQHTHVPTGSTAFASEASIFRWPNSHQTIYGEALAAGIRAYAISCSATAASRGCPPILRQQF